MLSRIDDKAVNDFFSHHGVKGMLPGFPKTNLERISRVARGTVRKRNKIADMKNEKTKSPPSAESFVEGLLNTKFADI